MFGAGCFWGVQAYFDQVPGVTETVVGYSGGRTENPSYEAVCRHKTGHAEVVQLEFDPSKVSYEVIVKHFFRMHNPTQLNRQGWDIGDNYRSAIFYYDNDQKVIAENIKNESQENFKKRVVTEITKASVFYPAEDYHQKYAERTGRGSCHVAYQPIA